MGNGWIFQRFSQEWFLECWYTWLCQGGLVLRVFFMLKSWVINLAHRRKPNERFFSGYPLYVSVKMPSYWNNKYRHWASTITLQLIRQSLCQYGLYSNTFLYLNHFEEDLGSLITAKLRFIPLILSQSLYYVFLSPFSCLAHPGNCSSWTQNYRKPLGTNLQTQMGVAICSS